MVGLPTNTNMYLPLADSPSIRKVSLVNFSNEGYELSLNGPAFIMLDMSDLGMSYDIESIGSGIVSRKLKEKDITYTLSTRFQAKPGTYRLAIAIVDTTQGNEPGLQLAVSDKETVGKGWVCIDNVTLK